MKKERPYNITKGNGGNWLLNEPVTSFQPSGLDLVRLTRRGVLIGYLFELADRLSFNMKELARVLHISERTLQRYKNNEVLTPGASEKAVLLSQLYKKGISVLGSSENFNDWLRTPLPAFNQDSPISYLDTTFGFDLIFEELGRIEHGVFA